MRPHLPDIESKKWRFAWASSKDIQGNRNRLGKFDLDRTRRIAAIEEDKSKCRSIIIKFWKYNVRDKVFKNKKKLEGKDYSINESLAALRMKKLTEAGNSFGFTNLWTQDGRILCKEDNKDFLTICAQIQQLEGVAWKQLLLVIFIWKERRLGTLVKPLKNVVGT